ncbi:MAG: hypothetical protein ACOH1K_06330 [Rhodoglobus sp.]
MRHSAKSRRSFRLSAVVLVVVLVTLLGLASLYFIDPKIVTIGVGLAGIIGGSMVVYDVRLTKRIAQPELISGLNNEVPFNGGTV